MREANAGREHEDEVRAASESDSTRAVRDMARGSKNRATETLRGLFCAAVKVITRRDENEPPPKQRRRSGETEGGFRRLARNLARRFNVRRDFRQRAAITSRSVTIPDEAFAVAPPYLFNAFDLHNQWDDAADFDENHDMWQSTYLLNL